MKMRSAFSKFNEKMLSSREISGIGMIGTMRLLRGKVAKGLNYIGRCLSYTSTRAYGCFLLSFGMLSLILNFGEYYFMQSPEVHISEIIISTALALISPLLFITDKPMCIAMQDFALTDRLFFEFLSIKRMHRNVTHASISPLVAIFLGFLPAVVGFFVPLYIVVSVIVVGTCVAIAFTSPEFSMIASLLLLPYVPAIPHSVLLLCSISTLTFLSYALKVVLGKRTFHLDYSSILIILASVLILIGGMVSDGDGALKTAAVFVILMLGGIPCANMIINRRLADCAINAVIVSSVPITVLSIIEAIVESSYTGFTPPSYSTPGISALFSTPAALAAFLLVSAISNLIFAKEKRNTAKKSFYYVMFALEIAVLAAIALPEIWLVAVVAVLASPLVKSRRIPLEILALLIILPMALLLFPNSVLDEISGYFEVAAFSDRIAGYKESIDVFLDNAWLGIGMSADAYRDAAVSDTGGIFNTLLAVAVENGAIVLALFAALVMIRLRHISYYRAYMRASLVSVSCELTAVAIVILLALGSFENIFADVTVHYLFWVVFGISSAALRTARREHDDLLGYYGDSRSSESAALDVETL